MNPTAQLRFPYQDPDDARRIHGALHADDDGYVTTRIEAATLHVDAEAPNLRGLLRALDDVLANVAIAEAVDATPDPDEESA